MCHLLEEHQKNTVCFLYQAAVIFVYTREELASDVCTVGGGRRRKNWTNRKEAFLELSKASWLAVTQALKEQKALNWLCVGQPELAQELTFKGCIFTCLRWVPQQTQNVAGGEGIKGRNHMIIFVVVHHHSPEIGLHL